MREWPDGPDIARLVAVLIVTLLVQTTVAPNLRLLGAHPDFALVIVVCVGLLRGAEVGAVFGFLAGSLVAVALMEPLGVGAFVFVLVGYLAGRYAETADLSADVAPMVSAFVGGLLANLLFALVQFLLERQMPLGFFTARVLLPSLVLNTLLAVPLFLLVRWALGGGGVLRVRETA